MARLDLQGQWYPGYVQALHAKMQKSLLNLFFSFFPNLFFLFAQQWLADLQELLTDGICLFTYLETECLHFVSYWNLNYYFLIILFLWDAKKSWKVTLRKFLFICTIYVIIYEWKIFKKISVFRRTIALNIFCFWNISSVSRKLTSLQDQDSFVIF